MGLCKACADLDGFYGSRMGIEQAGHGFLMKISWNADFWVNHSPIRQSEILVILG